MWSFSLTGISIYSQLADTAGILQTHCEYKYSSLYLLLSRTGYTVTYDKVAL